MGPYKLVTQRPLLKLAHYATGLDVPSQPDNRPSDGADTQEGFSTPMVAKRRQSR